MWSACKWVRGRQKTLSASNDSQLPLAQNNPYVGIFRGGIFWMPSRIQRRSIKGDATQMSVSTLSQGLG